MTTDNAMMPDGAAVTDDSPMVWKSEPNQKWYHRTATRFPDDVAIFGPFDTEADAFRSYTLIFHRMMGWRPPASEAIEIKMAEFSRLEDEIATLEETISARKAARKHLAEVELPEAVDEVSDVSLRLTGVRLADGREYEFDTSVYCGVPKDRKPEAHGYLVSKGADALLKNTIVIRLGNNSHKIAAELRAAIARLLPAYEISVRVGKAPDALVVAIQELLDRSGINPTVDHETELPGATLSAYVKRQLKLGVALPDYFGVYAPMRAVLVSSKANMEPRT